MDKKNVFKNIFTKKTTDYTFTILFFLIFSVFIVFAIRPSLTTATALKRENEDLKRVDSLYESKIINIASVQNLMEENRDRLSLLSEAVADSPQVNKMIQDIKDVGSQNSFIIKKASIGEVTLTTTNKKNLQKVLISIEGVSSFEDFIKFTRAVIDQRRLKTINKLTIGRDKDSSTSAQLKINMDIEGYFL